MTEVEYVLKFPKQQLIFNDDDLTFSINHIKSRLGCVVYFKFNCFDSSDTKIHTYVSPRWYIDTEYHRRVQEFNIPTAILDRTYYTQIEMITIGTNSENPLYFSECMLNEGADIGEYHTPYEQIVSTVGVFNTRYANLYTRDGNYVQVIRPAGDGFSTNKLNASTCTVLAPHLYDESDIDEPTNIFLEFIHQREQRIDVLR